MTDNQPIHVLLVTGRDQVSTWLISVLRAEAGVVLAGVVPTLERAVPLIGQRPIDVLLLDSAVPDAQQLDRLQAIAAPPSAPAILLAVATSEMPFVQQAMFAGARGFLLKPFTEDQLMDSLRQTYTTVMQQRHALSLAAPALASPTESAEIVALFSPKGGVGRTALATNLAVALHHESRKRVTLVDGDLQFGDIDIAVNVMARKSIADLLPYINELEAALIDSVLINHASGVRLLLAPPVFDPAFEEETGNVAHVIKSLAATHSGYVVVDVPAGLSESTLSVLDIAQRVLLVTTASIASLRATKRFLELAHKMEFPDHKLMLVVSGYRKGDISLADIEHHLGWPVTMVVPSDPIAMAMALNQGQPIVMRDRNHPISKAVIKLARYLDTGSVSSEVQAGNANQPTPMPDKLSGAALSVHLKPQQALGT